MRNSGIKSDSDDSDLTLQYLRLEERTLHFGKRPSVKPSPEKPSMTPKVVENARKVHFEPITAQNIRSKFGRFLKAKDEPVAESDDSQNPLQPTFPKLEEIESSREELRVVTLPEDLPHWAEKESIVKTWQLPKKSSTSTARPKEPLPTSIKPNTLRRESAKPAKVQPAKTVEIKVQPRKLAESEIDGNSTLRAKKSSFSSLSRTQNSTQKSLQQPLTVSVRLAPKVDVFAPKRSLPPKESSRSNSQRLYLDHFYRQKILEEKQKAQKELCSARELEQCPFRPTISPPPPRPPRPQSIKPPPLPAQSITYAQMMSDRRSLIDRARHVLNQGVPLQTEAAVEFKALKI